MDGLQRCFDQLAWPEADQAAKQPGATLVWPFGACEQHGPQLPLATDALFADRILNSVFEHLDAALPIWRLPVQSIGFSPEHQPFPGTLSLSAELMLQLVDQVGGQLASMGVKRLVLFNAHGGQIGLLQVAARQLRLRAEVRAQRRDQRAQRVDVHLAQETGLHAEDMERLESTATEFGYAVEGSPIDDDATRGGTWVAVKRETFRLNIGDALPRNKQTLGGRITVTRHRPGTVGIRC